MKNWHNTHKREIEGGGVLKVIRRGKSLVLEKNILSMVYMVDFACLGMLLISKKLKFDP